MRRVTLKATGLARVLPGAVPVTLVRDISLEVTAGEFVAITGPSGSGKSSLLYLLGLLDRPSAGSVEVDGQPTADMSGDQLAALRLAKLGFVFQFHFLLPEFSAAENVMVPLQRAGRLDSRAIAEWAAGLLAMLGLADAADKRPDQLSGGQRQRVAIARALANDPLVLLADEPTGSLDSVNARIVWESFADLAHKQQKTVIVVTHNAAFAAAADRRVHLVDGRIVSDRPATA
ncbi:MAG: ABC transporter ATP-binding protein [Alphaproteobacteria bacterium]|nr:ABC transporter ATP-binding protein [Alphaproteobacteria bacterium]